MVAFAVVTCNNIPIILGHLKQWQFCVEVPTDDSYYWTRFVVNDSCGLARGGEWPRLCTPTTSLWRQKTTRQLSNECLLMVELYQLPCQELQFSCEPWIQCLVIVNLVIDYGIPETYLLNLGMFTMTTYVF